MRGLDLLAPPTFVVLWATGYIVARIAIEDGGALSFLAWRYGVALIAMTLLAFALGARWPARAVDWLHSAVVGALVHAGALGCVWVSLEHGLLTGVSALVMGTQPLLTAGLAMVFLGERLDRRQTVGLLVGFAGLAVVVGHRLDAGTGTGAGFAIVGAGVMSLTLGTLYQKRFCADQDLLGANVPQFLAASAVMIALALATSDRPVEWTVSALAVLGWSVLVLSIGATTILYWLIRRGAVSRVASLLYLVPPVTAMMGWLAFDERLRVTVLAGMALTVVGVALVVMPGAAHKRRAAARQPAS